jgi:aldehyde dehydrogenase (NAD+)
MSEAPPTQARPAFENFIGGSWQPSRSGDTYRKYGPTQPNEPFGVFPASGEADVEAAVAAADGAFADWAATPAAKRGAILGQAAEALAERTELVARDMTYEMGKPVRETRIEVARAADVLRFFAGEAWRPKGELYEQSASGSALYTARRPLGVVALVTPWNFPVAIPTWKLAPALVFGNTVVLKPAQEAPLSALHLASCLEQAGLPASVLNVVIGRGGEVGNPLVEHERVRAVSFTGSVPVGERLRDQATGHSKRVQLELGGHNPLIVQADADLSRAVEAAYAGAFWSAGQKCTSTRRIYVHEAVYDEFKGLLMERMKRGRVGDPTDPSTEVGPIVNRQQLDEVVAAIARGRADGGTVLAGGELLEEDSLLLAPTLFEGVSDAAFLSCEEVFGPVTSLYPYSALDEAIERANAVRFGLAAAIFTRDASAIQQFVDTAQAGLLHINQPTTGADVHVPFGGRKGSGYGLHEQGRAAIEFYTDLVTVYQDF